MAMKNNKLQKTKRAFAVTKTLITCTFHSDLHVLSVPTTACHFIKIVLWPGNGILDGLTVCALCYVWLDTFLTCNVDISVRTHHSCYQSNLHCKI